MRALQLSSPLPAIPTRSIDEIRNGYDRLLQTLRSERDRLQRSCELVLREGLVDVEARHGFTQAVKRISELHDQIYEIERQLERHPARQALS